MSVYQNFQPPEDPPVPAPLARAKVPVIVCVLRVVALIWVILEILPSGKLEFATLVKALLLWALGEVIHYLAKIANSKPR